MRNKLLLLALAVTFTFSSCSKDDDSDPAPAVSAPTKTDLLVNKYWTLTGHIINASWDPSPIDYYATLKACERDNYILLSGDYRLIADEGDTKCNLNDSQILRVGTWLLANREKTLIINLFNSTTEYEILELTENKLVLKSVFFSGGSSAVETLTYSAQ